MKVPSKFASESLSICDRLERRKYEAAKSEAFHNEMRSAYKNKTPLKAGFWAR